MTSPGQDWEQFADLPGIDFAKGMDTWRDFTLFRQFMQQFAIDHACSANQFSALLGAGEWEAASALMHKLKGAAATLSLTAVFQAAQAIEDCTNAQAAGALLPKLRPALDMAFASIAQLAPAASPAAPSHADPARAAPLMTALLQAFDAGTAGPAGLLMADLTPSLPAGALGAIQDCLDGANFRAGATLVRELAREQDIALG